MNHYQNWEVNKVKSTIDIQRIICTSAFAFRIVKSKVLNTNTGLMIYCLEFNQKKTSTSASGGVMVSKLD